MRRIFVTGGRAFALSAFPAVWYCYGWRPMLMWTVLSGASVFCDAVAKRLPS